jgi:hypothetical protein
MARHPASRRVTSSNRPLVPAISGLGSTLIGLPLARQQRDSPNRSHRAKRLREGLGPTVGTDRFHDAQCLEARQSPRYERASALSCASVEASPSPTILPSESR